MEWFVVFDLPAQTSLIVVQGTEKGGQVHANGKIYNLRAGPFPTKFAAEAWVKAHSGGSAGSSSGGGSGSGSGGAPPVQHVRCGTPLKSWTFGRWERWIDCRAPGKGLGDQFITWVEDNYKPSPPFSDKIDLNSTTYGPTTLTSGNHAWNFFVSWLLIGKVEPNLAKLIAVGIQVGAKDTVTAGTGAAESLSLSGLLTGFLSGLTARGLWVRIAEGVLGIAIVVVAASKLVPNTSVGRAATKVGKSVKIL